MAIVQVVVSILMFVAILIAIQKKFNPITTLLMTGTVVLLLWSIFTGYTPLGEATTGSAILDTFEYFKAVCIKYFPSGIIIMAVLGYVGYMNNLQATDLFAQFLAKPLRKLKNPYLVGALVILLGWIFVTALPSGVAIVALLFGVVYPIMRKVGLSPAASASAITIGCATYLAPGNPGTVNVLAMFDTSVTASELFAQGLPYMALYIVVAMIVYLLTAKFFDKREAAKGIINVTAEVENENVKEIKRPKWYAIFPVLPIVFTIVFSSIVAKSVVLSAVGACFLSFCIVFVVELIYTRKPQMVFSDAVHFYNGLGDGFGKAGMVGIAGMVFSAALSAVGGIQILATALTSISNMPIVAIIVFFMLVYALLFYVTGTFAISLYSIIPIVNATLTTMGRTDLIVPAVMCALLMGQCVGQCSTPISAATLFISGATGVAPTTVSKRNALPAILGGLVSMAAVLIFMV